MAFAAKAESPPTVTLVDVIAAVHHPVRRRLIELLHLEGPATVSRLAEAADIAIGNASHHLKVLAAANLVEEAPELAKDRRERWWRGVSGSISWSVADFEGDPVAEVVAAAAEQQNLAHHVGKMQQWYARRDGFSDSWVRAAFSTESWALVSAAELQELGARINALLVEYGDRAAAEIASGDVDAAKERVFVFAHGVPARP